ncbi:glycosyltransferase family A protein [Kluyvera ascorbata]|uniref:glycosyltransferase family A protein n=1 Tax=Kluyvera ascorbata TaxID=51288 RepID=UPI0022E49BAB|nr:glycosyltransferase family A protein [Kluyvera ascorbata]HDG1679448.1 glycosyltransferase family 2 protein [Kluyvera ascorbata]
MDNAKLNFIIPVRHYDSVNNWNSVKSNISRTLQSIAGQSYNNWHCYIVCNKGTDLPAIDDNFTVVTENFPYVTLPIKKDNPELYHDMIRMDKGMRVYAGFKKCKSSDFFMVVDYDDFVHQDLSLFVCNSTNVPDDIGLPQGWLISHGYLYSGGSFALRNKRFDEVCGTSNIVKVSFIESFYDQSGSLSDKHIKELLGSHRFIKYYMNERAMRYESLPFYGAVYNVGISNSASQTTSVLDSLLSLRNTLRAPRGALNRWLSLSYFSRVKRKKFTINL